MNTRAFLKSMAAIVLWPVAMISKGYTAMDGVRSLTVKVSHFGKWQNIPIAEITGRFVSLNGKTFYFNNGKGVPSGILRVTDNPPYEFYPVFYDPDLDRLIKVVEEAETKAKRAFEDHEKRNAERWKVNTELIETDLI